MKTTFKFSGIVTILFMVFLACCRIALAADTVDVMTGSGEVKASKTEELWGITELEMERLPYLIHPGDILEINVFGEKYMHDPPLHIRVGYEGNIYFPLLGEVHMAGLTEIEGAKKLDDMLMDGYLTDPKVTVWVIEQVRATTVKTRQFSISGAVKKPGKYGIESSMSLVDAVSLGNGLLESADDARVRVIRKTGGETKEYVVNLEEDGLDFAIRVRDKIVVDIQGNYIVYGQVKKPGKYILGENVTASYAILSAGGFTDIASRNGVRVIRKLEDGKTKIFKVPVDRIYKTGKDKKDVILQDGDIVTVPESWI